MDDRTVGLILRALRRRRGWTQGELGRRADCSQSLVSMVEAGHVGVVRLDRLRRLFATADAKLDLLPRWRGADLDRLLDAAHADLVADVARRLRLQGWEVAIEVTYSEYGERGSIDVMGLLPARRAVLIVEVKTDIPSSEATGRKLDEKARLAPKIVLDRFGWRPEAVGRVLFMPDTGRLRRIASSPAMALMLPTDAVAVRRWLRSPIGPLAATWFVPNIGVRNPRRIPGPRKRAPSASPNTDQDRPGVPEPLKGPNSST
ncbi:MAG TPA: helix-turn-helix transcriptional regulator [Candidatus Limnocylindrales bacterium]